MIKQIGKSKFRLYSKRTKRVLGTFPSRKAAVKREKQIQYFKRQGS